MHPRRLREPSAALPQTLSDLPRTFCDNSTNPSGAALTAKLEDHLGRGAPGPPSWHSLPDVAALLAEWLQASSLLLGLLGRLPAADELAAYEDDEYEQSPLDDLVPIP